MLANNLKKINEKIKLACDNVQRQVTDVTTVAVTKSVGSSQAKELIELGIINLAENRVDKLLEKKEALKEFSTIKWHLIGNLQRRKVKLIINEIDYFHALDSMKLAEEIQKRSQKTLPCFVEVNISGEVSKSGLEPEKVLPFLSELAAMNKIKIIGLMCMAPFDATESELHVIFKQLKDLQQKVYQQKLPYAPCTELSMGMSNDFPIAIEEGATFVRIGSAIFRSA